MGRVLTLPAPPSDLFAGSPCLCTCRVQHPQHPLRTPTISLLALLPLTACADSPSGPQRLEAPEFSSSDDATVLRLPPALREVSALERAGEHSVACLEDETGALYFVRLDAPHPIERVPFGAPGDYEGLARVDDRWFVLLSGGVLMELARRGDRFEVTRSSPLTSEHTEFESLAFDRDRRRLLTISKDRSRAEGASSHHRSVFAFDVDLNTWLPEPVASLSRKVIRRDAERLGLKLPTRETKKGETKVRFEFAPSALTIDPNSNLRWVVSGPDRTLLAFDEDWNLVGSRVFGAAEAPQPEGVVALRTGQLVVATESGGAGGRLLILGIGTGSEAALRNDERPGHR